MATPYFNDPAYGWADPQYTPPQMSGALSGTTGSIPSGPLSGTGGWQQRAMQFLDPQVALPIAAALMGTGNFSDHLAGAFQVAGQAIPDMRKRAALNAYLKSQSGLNLTPEEQQLLQSDPELARSIAAARFVPKPKQLQFSPSGQGYIFEPTSGNVQPVVGGGGAWPGTGVDATDSNIIQRGQSDPAYRATPEYQLAWNRTAAPKYIQGTDDNGNPALIPTQPTMAGLLPPTGAGAPATPATDGVAAPAAGGGPAPGIGKPITTGKAKPTETAARAAGLYAKAAPDYTQAIKHFDALKSVGNQALDYLGLPGRMLQSSEYQVARNAAKSVVASYQYAASGASAPEEEVQRNLSLVMPDPSDGEAAIADKKARLSSMMQAMQIVAQGGRIPPEMVKQIGIDVVGPGVADAAGAGGAPAAPGVTHVWDPATRITRPVQ